MPQTLSFHGIRWQLYLTKHGPVTQGESFKVIHLLFVTQNLFICLAPKQRRIYYCKDECHTLHRVRKNSLRNTAYNFSFTRYLTHVSSLKPRKKVET